MIHRHDLFRPYFWLITLFAAVRATPQPYGQPDRGEPGDAQIQAYLAAETERIETNALARSAAEWTAERPRLKEEYLHMLGLSPLPERTPLRPQIVRTLEKEGYAVELLHFQSRPGLYVTANLYRPAKRGPQERLPAVLYVCGHSSRGRNGNKTAFQSHGIWFARHGYICLVVDTLQLGEIAGIHHGTYREGRWWWLARGYTPAGVECWNGMRAIDYLISRPDVDAARIGVTGISGGGAATFWIAAADDRVKVAIPVSGMADLRSYVANRVINGHCDCMFLYNTYQWPWSRIAALIGPRPMLFVNSDQDAIFPMDANERVINRLERFYSLFGAGDLVDSFVSIGGHDYRKDIRQAVARFMNISLRGDPAIVEDTEVDLVIDRPEAVHPLAPEELRVFPRDSDIPADAINARIDESFVPRAQPGLPANEGAAQWKDALLTQLRDTVFHHFPRRIPPARLVSGSDPGSTHLTLATEPGITVGLRAERVPPTRVSRVILLVTTNNVEAAIPEWLRSPETDAVYVCQPRGIGPSRWTRKHPPNYVERSHYLLGRTVDSGRVWDAAAVAGYLAEKHPGASMIIAGERGAGIVGVYAALLQPAINAVALENPPASHMDSAAPVLLNVLRVFDIPEAIGLLAPRSVTVGGGDSALIQRAQQIYRAAGAPERIKRE